jgi:hypothetical protein
VRRDARYLAHMGHPFQQAAPGHLQGLQASGAACQPCCNAARAAQPLEMRAGAVKVLCMGFFNGELGCSMKLT